MLKLLVGLLPLTLSALAVSATQYDFYDAGSSQTRLSFGDATYDYGMFSPMEDLSALSSTQYSTLSHPAFPSYEVRIKRSDFCDGSVRYVFDVS